MSHKVDLVRVLTSATGNSTPITLGAAYSQLFMTTAEAGAIDGRTYTWLIVDGNNWELVKGVYTASGTTMARTTVLASRISGTLGTSRISLSGTAQVRIIAAAEDMDGVRGTRSVTGTSDTLSNNDQGYVVTYSNASAIAVSLAQAGASSLFLDGWATWAQNLGAGTVTITPATSTINGGSTLVLAQNLGAFIWSDGTNYHAYIIPITKPLLATNNLSDVSTAATALGNLNGVSYGAAQSLTSGQRTQARTNINAVLKGQLWGLTLSAAGGSTSFGIALGEAADSTGVDLMTLASAYTKTTGAWAVGSGSGSFDGTGNSPASHAQWCHVFLIKRPDTGVVDILTSNSATAPTLPANYTLFRRIGSIKTDTSFNWLAFTQYGDTFVPAAATNEVNTTSPASTLTAVTLAGVPSGVSVTVQLRVVANATTAGLGLLIANGDETMGLNGVTGDRTLSTPVANNPAAGPATVVTNATAQIKYQNDVGTWNLFSIVSQSYVDRRGRDA